MMAQSWRDPLFRAALAVANRDLDATADGPAGDWCIRCHAPMGWLQGHSLPADGAALVGAELDGVQCSVCHRLADAVAVTAGCPDPADGHDLSCDGPNFSGKVLAYDNAEMVIDPGIGGRELLHGPYSDPRAPHPAAGGPTDFAVRGDACGTCHNVTSPVVSVPSVEAIEAAGRPDLAAKHRAIAGEPMPIERTHVEWSVSAAAAEGVRCQDCHMPATSGRAALGGPVRAALPVHSIVGGNTWAPLLVPLFFPDEAPRREAFAEIAAEAGRMLRRFVDLGVERFEPGLAVVRVTNDTGHKLPTGYPEGRRMWLHVEGFDAVGERIYESGAYDPPEARLALDDAGSPTPMGNPTKVWEIQLGILDRAAGTITPSFHFALNDVVVKDNRIPPRGFEVAAGAQSGALIVKEAGACSSLPVDLRPGCDDFGWGGADGRATGDDYVAYRLPEAVVRVRATLFYQTASREYVDFLSTAANAADWADRFVAGIAAAYSATGRSTPVEMTTTERAR
jgi:hypothetical protein